MTNEKLIEKPILIIGCNRSGTTLLFRNLSEHPRTWTLYEEGQDIFYRCYPQHEELGDRVVASPSPEEAERIRRDFFRAAHNKELFKDTPLLKLLPRKLFQRPLSRLYKRAPLRLVEKTPANSLRVPLLAELFPSGRFIFLIRRPEEVISSLMQGWRRWSGVTGEWSFTKWHYLAPPGWRQWTNRSLEEICAFQWIESVRIAWEDLNEHCGDRFMLVRHEDAVSEPRATYREILEFCELPASGHFDRQVNRSAERVFTHGGSKPRPEKWKDLHEAEIDAVRPMFQPLRDRFYAAG